MSWTMVIVFVAGLSVGTMFGVVLAGLLRAANRDDAVRTQQASSDE